jgi:SAM-dependent methyltransferase
MDATAWDERYRSKDSVWGIEPNRFVREHCESLPVGEALDLACGEGRNALWLARLGWQVTGIDFSEVAIERARALTTQLAAVEQQRVDWRVDDVTTLLPEPASLDLLLVSYLHIPASEFDEMLSRTATALRPSGHLLVVGHDKRNPAEGVSGPQDIARLYDPEHLRELLVDECGLFVEIARTVERPTEEGIALDTLVRARRD